MAASASTIESAGDQAAWHMQVAMRRCIPEAALACRLLRTTAAASDPSLWRLESVLTLFPAEHTSELDRAVVGNQLTETPSTGRSNRLVGGLTALDRRDTENLDSLLREGPRREQCA
jgi:hypothetical protein